MAAKQTPWLMYGLLAGGAYVAYRLYQNYATAATPAATTTTVPATTSTTAPVTSAVLTPGLSPQLPGSVVPAAIPGITAQVYSIVQDWATTDGRAPVLAMAAADVPSEYAGMYDLITNYWDQNIAPGPTQVAFWNALRAKYDPGDAIW
jgi:hypothetical protein